MATSRPWVEGASDVIEATCTTGSDIPIEIRPDAELRQLGGVQVAHESIPVWNPAFDVTPTNLISGWVTEHGIWKPPFPTPMDD